MTLAAIALAAACIWLHRDNQRLRTERDNLRVENTRLRAEWLHAVRGRRGY